MTIAVDWDVKHQTKQTNNNFLYLVLSLLQPYFACGGNIHCSRLLRCACLSYLSFRFTCCFCDKHQSGDEIHLALSMQRNQFRQDAFLSRKDSNQTNVKYVLFQQMGISDLVCISVNGKC